MMTAKKPKGFRLRTPRRLIFTDFLLGRGWAFRNNVELRFCNPCGGCKHYGCVQERECSKGDEEQERKTRIRVEPQADQRLKVHNRAGGLSQKDLSDCSHHSGVEAMAADATAKQGGQPIRSNMSGAVLPDLRAGARRGRKNNPATPPASAATIQNRTELS